MDSDAGEIAKGNKPIELHINEEMIKVKLGRTFLLSSSNRDSLDFDFGFILNNQTELFRRDETIIK